MDPPHSYILEEGICYLALCDPTYPAKLAFNYLENLHKDFSEQHGNDVHKASRPYHFIEFGTYLYLPSIFCRLIISLCFFPAFCTAGQHQHLQFLVCVLFQFSVATTAIYSTECPSSHTHSPPPHTHSPPPHAHTHTHMCRSQ